MRLWKKHPQLETDRGKSNSASGSDDFAVRVITDTPVSLPLGEHFPTLPKRELQASPLPVHYLRLYQRINLDQSQGYIYSSGIIMRITIICTQQAPTSTKLLFLAIPERPEMRNAFNKENATS